MKREAGDWIERVWNMRDSISSALKATDRRAARDGSGRIDEVNIIGDHAEIRVLRDGIDPKLKGPDPGIFSAYAVPLDNGRP